jgi:RNA polymerase sigma-70 factor (ECF subfamily)
MPARGLLMLANVRVGVSSGRTREWQSRSALPCLAGRRPRAPRPPPQQPVAADLLRRGQLQDFGAFYESTYPAAYRVAYGVVGERTLAEDVTQEAYVTAYRKRGSYRADGAAEAWLYRIVVNTAISMLRQRRVRPIQPLDPEADQRPSVADAAPAAVDHVALVDGLGRLDPVSRSAVVLRYYLDLDYATIGSILGLRTHPGGRLAQGARRGSRLRRTCRGRVVSQCLRLRVPRPRREGAVSTRAAHG